MVMRRTVRDTKSLGAFIHDARVKANLTQQELANRAGVLRRWLIDIEQGAKSGAEIGKIFALLKTLEVEVRLSSADEEPPTEVSSSLTPAELTHLSELIIAAHTSQAYAESPLQQRLRKNRQGKQ